MRGIGAPVGSRLQHNLILGVAEGMSWQAMQPFIVSLRSSDFKGDIVLFTADLDRGTLQSLASAGVDISPMRRLQVTLLGHRLTPYDPRLRRLFPLYARFIRSLSSVSRYPDITSARLAALISVRDMRRFFLYYTYLAKHGSAYANVMLTDVRDVIFQADPFESDFGDELYCFLEDERETLATQRNNRKWLQSAFGDGILDEVGGCPIACAGVTIGPRELVLGYLKVMTASLVTLPHQHTGIDQAVHNYVLHKGLVSRARFVPNGTGLVSTLGIVPREDVDRLLGAPVLHQYDRHPDVASTLLQRLAEIEMAAAAHR